MADLNPSALKSEAETLLKDAEEVLTVLEDLPLPANLKAYVVKADAFVKDVNDFLG